MRWVLLGIVFITILYSPLVHNVVNFPINNGNFHNLEDHNLEQVVKKCYGPVVLVFNADLKICEYLRLHMKITC